MAELRLRRDVWGISVRTLDAARTDVWDPILDGYARGVAAMMDRDAQLTVHSWLWAANTHGIPPGTPGKPLWDECKHAARLFLPWHRAYLTWFESTIRGAIGDDTWALPYWDYSDPDRPETLQLPPEFLVPQRTVDGALIDNALFISPLRRPGHPEAINVEVVEAMSERFFVRNFPQQGFGGIDDPFRLGGLIEQEPHNFVHVDIGVPNGLMGNPAVAARDPIFWLHHSNIDRLWEVWRGLPGSVGLLEQDGVSAASATEWQSASFAFGGNGSTEVYSIDQVMNPAAEPLGYGYENLDLTPAQLAEVTARRQAAQGGVMGLDENSPPPDQWEPVASTGGATEVGEQGAQDVLSIEPGVLGLDAATPSGLIIALMGVTAPVNCHGAYVVEVAVSEDDPGHTVGRFSTFGLIGTPPEEQRTYSIDATPAIELLTEDGWAGRDLVVRVRPETPAEDAGAAPEGLQIEQITVFQRP